jgi:phosphopantetheine--protein transferase-like protein
VSQVPVAGCHVEGQARQGRSQPRHPRQRDRVFTAREQAAALRGDISEGSDVHVARLAARFAAKEAARKALGDLRLPFHDTEVVTHPDGAPELWLRGRPSGLALSLSHDGGIAMAVVFGLRDRHSPTITAGTAGEEAAHS